MTCDKVTYVVRFLATATRQIVINWREVLKKRIPIVEWFPKYTLALFWQDLLAGFTVALTEIPQGIAYAYVAGKK